MYLFTLMYKQYLPQLQMGWEWPFGKKKNQPAENYNPQGYETAEPEFQSHSFVRSYSTSKICKKDPENDEYMICKEKINDGNNTVEKEERIPVQQPPSMPKFSKFSNDTTATGIPNELGSFEDIDRIFNGFMSIPFFSSRFPFDSAFPEPTQPPSFFTNTWNEFHQTTNNPQFNQQSKNQHQNKGPSQNSRNKHYFTFKEEKDYDIKDI